MPLINGMKMACEPCIRGHRSTKCNHANERLMVPVRKPGRPLSQCPHPRDQSCGCGTVVTAAIPRKQACGCGTGSANTAASSQSSSPQSVPISTPIDAPSPTRANFKIQKARPQSSRKQSFDIANLERMDMNSVNVIPFQQQAIAPSPILTGVPFQGYPPAYGYVPQYVTMQPQIGHTQMAPPPLPLGAETMISSPTMLNGFGHAFPQNGFDVAVESPLTTPIAEEPRAARSTNGVSSCCQPKPEPKPIVETQPQSNGSSCCGPKKESSEQISTSKKVTEEPKQGGCCGSKENQKVKLEPISAASTPLMQPQMLVQNGVAFNPGMYQQYMPHPTVFSYPAAYGSFQNPLHPEAWRESMRNNSFLLQQQQMPPQQPTHAFEAPLIPGTMDTIHTCSCGDTCSCIGCAAHPYNEETKEYIRSAWDAMNLETHAEVYTNGITPHANENSLSNGNAAHQNGDFAGSPAANTPSSTTSANAEEQSLSAADFFFVSYPFAGDGCGGDTNSCPCGEDCQCLGCTIHNHDTSTIEPVL